MVKGSAEVPASTRKRFMAFPDAIYAIPFAWHEQDQGATFAEPKAWLRWACEQGAVVALQPSSAYLLEACVGEYAQYSNGSESIVVQGSDGFYQPEEDGFTLPFEMKASAGPSPPARAGAVSSCEAAL